MDDQGAELPYFFMNCMLVFMTALISGVGLMMFSVLDGWEHPWRIFYCVVIYGPIMSLVYCKMTHSRANCAYRFTRSGFEYCRWRDLPEWVLPVLKWLSIFTAIVFLYLATHEPAMLIGALLGPGGMGLMYLRMAHSKGYQDIDTFYHHNHIRWDEMTQLAIATNREIVDFKYHLISRGEHPKSRWNMNIHCKPKQKEAVAAFMKPYLAPDTPFIRVKLDMLMSTDTHTPIVEN